MNDAEREVSIAEYRHEIVLKFAKGIVEGTIYVELTKIVKANVAATARMQVKMNDNIEKLFSGKLTPQELDVVEKEIFDTMCLFRSARLLSENSVNASEMEKRIDNLQARIDSTNNLLLQVLAVLKELVKMADGKKD